MTDTTHRYFHIGVSIPEGVVAQSVQDALDARCEDWLKYAGNCFIVWTTLDAGTLAGIVLSVSGMSKGSFLVVEIDTTIKGFGYISQWVLDWINKDRQKIHAEMALPLLKPPPS